jgi:hypothetical protein
MVAGAGFRAPVGLGAPIPTLRVGAPRLTLLPRRFKSNLINKNKKADPEGPAFFVFW